VRPHLAVEEILDRLGERYALPAHDYKDVVEGWETHYWGLWRYLAG
jgi:hypothetical protein